MNLMATQKQKIIGSCKIVDLDKLFVSDLNTRFQKEESPTSEAFKWLCDSIKSEGLVEPLVVRPAGNRYEIVAGTRRFAALKHIGASQAQVVVKEMDDQDVRIASLIENIHRLDLTEDEKEYTMRQIYLASWKEWVNPKDLQARPFATDDDKLALAKSYLNRMWNEHSRGANYSKVRSKFAGSNTEQKVFPTDEFKKLSSRVGYAITSQINILRGYGSISSDTDFYDELPPTYKQIADRIAKEKKLLEEEKQDMAKRMLTAKKKQKHDIKHPKTQIEKAETAAIRFANKVERERENKKRKEEEKKISRQEADLQASRVKQAKAREEERQSQESEIVQSAIRNREEILGLGHDLFKVLTGQELHGIDLEIKEGFATNTQATQTMQQLVTFSDRQDIAAQQHLIIPLNKALTKYRDILYEATENRKDKDRMSST
jgi:hypothetical protein